MVPLNKIRRAILDNCLDAKHVMKIHPTYGEVPSLCDHCHKLYVRIAEILHEEP
jgi:hypothetical protein